MNCTFDVIDICSYSDQIMGRFDRAGGISRALRWLPPRRSAGQSETDIAMRPDAEWGSNVTFSTGGVRQTQTWKTVRLSDEVENAVWPVPRRLAR